VTPSARSSAGFAPELAWDGQRHVIVAVDDPEAEGVLSCFALTDAGRWRLLARRRILRGTGLAPLLLAKPASGAPLSLHWRGADGTAALVAVRFDAAARPNADGSERPLLPAGPPLRAARAGPEGGADPAQASLTLGPALTDSQWAARGVALEATLTEGGVAFHDEAGRDASALDGLVRLYALSGGQGWTRLTPERWREPVSAALLLGGPGVAITLALGPDRIGPHREIALLANDQGARIVALDEALRAAQGSALVTASDRVGAMARREGLSAALAAAGAFSAYDPRVQAARADAARAFLAGPSPWEGFALPKLAESPFEAAGWPEALIGAVDSLDRADQALLADWTLAEPVTARLMAALRIAPDAPPSAEALLTAQRALSPLVARDAAGRLMALAARSNEPTLRMAGQTLASDLGTAWTVLSTAARVVAALGLADAEPATPAADAASLKAARALLGRFERIAGAVGVLAALDPGQDPLRGAARCRDPAIADVPWLTPAFAGVAAAVESWRDRAHAPPGLAASLGAAGRALAVRHLVSLVEGKAALGRGREEPADDAAALRRATLLRMRTALPEGLSSYLALAGVGAEPALIEGFQRAWGEDLAALAAENDSGEERA
jgi:hypothetical protein